MNDNYFLENWEREEYQQLLINSLPTCKQKIKLMNDVELMNLYDSDDWEDYIKTC